MKKIISFALALSMLTGVTQVYAQSPYDTYDTHTETMDFKNAQKEYYPSPFGELHVMYAKSLNIAPKTQTKSYLRFITREEFCKVIMDTYAYITNDNSVKNISEAEKAEIRKQYSDINNASNDVYNAIKYGFLTGTASGDSGGLKNFAPNNNVTKTQLKVVFTRMLEKAGYGNYIADSLAEEARYMIARKPLFYSGYPAIRKKFEQDQLPYGMDGAEAQYYASNYTENKNEFLAEPYMSLYGYGDMVSGNKYETLNYEEAIFSAVLVIRELGSQYEDLIKFQPPGGYKYTWASGWTDFQFNAEKGVTYTVYVDDVGVNGTYGGKRVLQYKVPETATDDFSAVTIKNADTVKRERTYRLEAVANNGELYKPVKVVIKDEISDIAVVGKETVSVKVWDIDKNGNKVTKTKDIIVNKDAAEAVKCIFEEIYNGKEKFPIKAVGGYADRNGTHGMGLGIDINPNENYFIKIDGTIVSGSFYKPYENPYSITPDGDVVKAFAKYGWYWGGFGWSTTGNDYMHFSYTGE